MWGFPDGELAVGFSRFATAYDTPASVSHGSPGKDRLLVRSCDGGESWTAVEQLAPEAGAVPLPDGVEFDPSAPDSVLYATGPHQQDRVIDLHVFRSPDRGHTWYGPTAFWCSRFQYNAVRSSFLVRPDGALLLFANGGWDEDNEHTSFPVVYGSIDGGGHWGLIGQVEPEPRATMAIMPQCALLPDGTMLMSVRRQYDGYSAYTQIYASADKGRTWKYRSRVNDWGSPASLTLLPDGRLVCVYGYRQQPWGIRAAVSEDRGHTWGDELVLRDDGGSWDLGYPRTVLRPDGALVTSYYFNDRDDATWQDGGVRYIAATIWRI
jgi:hypothetical protein